MGWNDKGNLRDDKCNFADPFDYDLKRAFAALGIDPRSVGDKGPNHCFHLEHWYGPTVVKLLNGQLPAPIDQKYMGPDNVLRRVRVHDTMVRQLHANIRIF